MISHERSMGLRALTVLPPPGTSLAMLPSMIKSGVCLKLMPTDTDEPSERDTLPPSPQTEPPPGFDPLPSEALKKMLGYEPDLFLHAALMAAADAAHEMRQSNKASSNIAALLDKQTQRILKETSADYSSLRSSIRGLQESVDALVTRVGNTESALDAGTKRFGAIEDELAAMRSQITRLEQLRPHLDRLDEQLQELRRAATETR